MLKRLFVLLGVLLLSSSITFAQDVVTEMRLKVLMTDGTSVSFPLSGKPVITYESGDMVVSAPNGNFGYKRQSVRELRFGDSTLGLDDIDAEDLNVCINGKEVTIYGCDNGNGIMVMDIQGKEMNVPVSVMDDQGVKVDLSSLVKSIYIIVIPNHQSIKIITK